MRLNWSLIPIKSTDLEVGEAREFSQEDRIKCLGSFAVCSPAHPFTMLEFMKRDDIAHLQWVNMDYSHKFLSGGNLLLRPWLL
jgi:hypothetical protein